METYLAYYLAYYLGWAKTSHTPGDITGDDEADPADLIRLMKNLKDKTIEIY